jgi:hypothetical protein
MTATADTTAADALRGHAFLPGPDDLATIPAHYATEATPLPDKIVHLRYCVGSCTWLVMEYDPDTGSAFGWADLGDPANAELGYFSLSELRSIVVSNVFTVERDLHWTARPFHLIG